MWEKYSSIYTLCFKPPPGVQPTQATLWLVGDIDTSALTCASSFDTWTVNVRLPPPTNTALGALLKSGPYKSYTSPVRYSILRVKATLPKVLTQLQSLEESGQGERAVPAHGELITAYEPYPFSYDGSELAQGSPMPLSGYDIHRFTDQTSVALELVFTGYCMDGREPGFSVAMLGIYHLGTLSTNTPSTPGKRKGGCILSPTRQRGAPFAPDPSKTT